MAKNLRTRRSDKHVDQSIHAQLLRCGALATSDTDLAPVLVLRRCEPAEDRHGPTVRMTFTNGFQVSATVRAVTRFLSNESASLQLLSCVGDTKQLYW